MDIFPPHIRALLFILIAFCLASIFLNIFLRRLDISKKWVVLWACITGVAYISENIWVVVFAVAIISIFVMPKKGNERIVFYFALLPILPSFNYVIPSILPGINYLFILNYPKTLALFILLPLFFRHISQPAIKRSTLLSSRVDKLVILYILLISALAFRETSITSGLREDFMIFLNIFLPYFVISRYVISVEDIQRVFVAIMFSGIMLTCVGLLEAIFSWDFYVYLRDLLGFIPIRRADINQWRGDYIRIEATMGPIPFGYFLALVFGIFLYLKDQYSLNKIISITTLASILSAQYFTGSRGAWLTTIIVSIIYIFLNIHNPRKKIGIVLAGILLMIGYSFIGGNLTYEDETGTFEYRKQLFYNSLGVISKHPIFGTANPLGSGDLEMMRQGQGIIDIVNTYIQVALHSGVTGLIIFALIFIVLLRRIYIKYNQLKSLRNDQGYKVGAILLALILATMVLIATVSSISFIPIYYWALVGLGSAYLRMTGKT